MYEYQEFPKWKYHPAREPVIVENAEQESALGDDWFDRPDEAVQAMERIRAALKKAEHDSA